MTLNDLQNDAPPLLCRICRRFREVAVSTPRLWTSLMFNVHTLSGAHFSAGAKRAYVDFWGLWLSRAGSLSLSVVWEGSGRVDLEDPLLSTIVGSSGQWRTLDISQTPDIWQDVSHNFLDSGSLAGKLPLLEELTLVAPTAVILPDAPKLRVLYLELAPFTPMTTSFSQIQLPWHQLANVRVGWSDIPLFGEILRNSTNLLQASFGLHRGEPPALPVSIIGHGRLQRLALKMTADDVVGDRDQQAIPLTILDWLEMPHLTELIVVLPYRPLVGTLTPLVSFLSHSALRLRTLALSLCYSPPARTIIMENMLECLKLASSLAHLKLKSSLMDMDDLFAWLVGDTDFLPRLETFDLVSAGSYSDSSLTPSLVVEMLCWRWVAVGITQLKSFRLVHYYPPKPPLASFLDLLKYDSEFQRLEREGMLLYTGHWTRDTDDFWSF